MLLRMWNIATFGKRYLWAAVAYAGVGIVIVSAMPAMTARAQSAGCTGEFPCPSGQICCNGICIPDTFVCCGDGTYGPASNCVCCTGCTNPCEGASTLQCQ